MLICCFRCWGNLAQLQITHVETASKRYDILELVINWWFGWLEWYYGPQTDCQEYLKNLGFHVHRELILEIISWFNHHRYTDNWAISGKHTMYSFLLQLESTPLSITNKCSHTLSQLIGWKGLSFCQETLLLVQRETKNSLRDIFF